MSNAGDRPYHRLLDGLADVSRPSFGIVLGVGAFLLALPVVLGLAFWLIMWPLSGLVDIETMIRRGTTGAGSTGDQFWAYWAQALVFLVIYGGIAWPLRALCVEHADSPLRGPDDDERTSHAQDVGRILTFSWRTFWFVVAAIVVGNLAASAVRGLLPTIVGLLEAALVTVVIPTSRAAVALALITTALERWANWWVKHRAENEPLTKAQWATLPDAATGHTRDGRPICRKCGVPIPEGKEILLTEDEQSLLPQVRPGAFRHTDEADCRPAAPA